MPYKSIGKKEWIGMVTAYCKVYSNMMHKGLVCQKCGKPAFSVDYVKGKVQCVECRADEIFDKKSSIEILMPDVESGISNENFNNKRANQL